MNNEKYGNRQYLLDKLDSYKGIDRNEEGMRKELILFVQGNENCFERSLLIGHVNGSAWIVDSSFQYVLLTHHTKLNKWLQLGGHSDGDANTFAVAYREAREESGLTSIKPISENIFDIDIHSIPARNDEPEHLHYDIRFAFTADKNEPLSISTESKDLQWVNLGNVHTLHNNDSVMRMVWKTK